MGSTLLQEGSLSQTACQDTGLSSVGEGHHVASENVFGLQAKRVCVVVLVTVVLRGVVVESILLAKRVDGRGGNGKARSPHVCLGLNEGDQIAVFY